MNILVTLDENYVPYLNVMLSSLKESNKGEFFQIYLLHTNMNESALDKTRRILGDGGRINMIRADEKMLDSAPTTSRYPKEIYYRIFAAKYLPKGLDRVLYLDPDIIVNGSLKKLYSLDMGDS